MESRHIQFVGRDHLLTLTDEGGSIRVDQFTTGSKHRNIVHRVQSDRLGPSFHFDFDESRRRLTFLTHEVRRQSVKMAFLMIFLQSNLIVYESDRYKFSALPPIKLEGFPFEDPGNISHVRFLPGRETVVIVDSKGNMALYSLISNQFRWELSVFRS
jgi:hypothetical protein